MNYHLHSFNTAQELWDAIRPESIHKTLGLNADNRLIYRGQADSSWLLSPNSARGKNNVNIEQQAKDEVQLILYFLEYCDNTGIQVPGDLYDLRKNLEDIVKGNADKDLYRWPSQKHHDVLAFAQHYGVPTRLLDWSKRSFVSAYFGASEVVKLIASEIEKGTSIDLDRRLAIWILDKNGVDYLNASTFHKNSSEPTNPFQIISVPSSTNAHIAAQQGCFSVFRMVHDNNEDVKFPECMQPPKFSCIKTIDNSNLDYVKHLHKLTLPYRQAHNLLDLCESYNANAASLFPTATGAAYAVIDRANNEIVRKYIKNIRD